MKTMKCKQLGGPESCEVAFSAETFDEIAQQSQTHGKEMFAAQDTAHIEAGKKMVGLMQDPKAMQTWMVERKREFETLPEDA